VSAARRFDDLNAIGKAYSLRQHYVSIFHPGGVKKRYTEIENGGQAKVLILL
jgi:hypothetical protein